MSDESARAESFNSPTRRRYRKLIDRLAGNTIAVGGVSVIAAVLMIFVYLLIEVLPLFRPAQIGSPQVIVASRQNRAEALHLATDDRGELLARIERDGWISFWTLQGGELVAEFDLGIPANDRIRSISVDHGTPGLFALGLESGDVLVASYGWSVSFGQNAGDRRSVPELNWPYGREPISLAERPLLDIAMRGDSDRLTLLGLEQTGQVSFYQASRPGNALTLASEPANTNSVEFSTSRGRWPQTYANAVQILLDGDAQAAYMLEETGSLRVFSLDNLAGAAATSARQVASAQLSGRAAELTLQWLGGAQSLLVMAGNGQLSQWLLIESATAVAAGSMQPELELVEIRRFADSSQAASSARRLLATQGNSRTFARLSTSGELLMLNATSEKRLLDTVLDVSAPSLLTFNASGDALLVEHSTGWTRWPLRIEHAEVSLSSLWKPVWYEGYNAPGYVWQSSSAGAGFEPKLSLVPLTFGTLKAAFYAMLLAAPLAICGAIYTGYFMAPLMRRKIKPLVELMEALPTVVLGFLAGIWLAPFVENNLIGVFSLLVLTPIGVLLASFIWFRLPPLIRLQTPPGLEAAILLPVVILVALFCFALGPQLEGLFFAGDTRLWLTEEFGIGYDQRNAMVVGFAMGFAVIPTIFSIAEDAIFTVPRHLSNGSLALGATSWQSLFRVVLPTASPGIFSGLMIGLGRAVGETMIVLMATGNTPIMDINIFEGMRTLAANMAVEVPESEVGSSHYRVLFLSAMLLFLFTFILNTVAELVRQSLREKYSSL